MSKQLEAEHPFDEPWQAHAFAMTVALYDRGAFTWDEWADALSSEIHSGVERDYHSHWLKALEKIARTKHLTTELAIRDREQEWHAAAARTPHGEPIEL